MKKYLIILLLIILFACKDDPLNFSDIKIKVDFYNPVGNLELTEGDSVNVIADAKVNDGKITRVDFIIDSEVFFTDSVSPFSKVLLFSKPGYYHLRLRAYDDRNESALSREIQVYVSENSKKPSVQVKLNRNEISIGDSIIVDVTTSSSNGIIKYTQLFINDNLYATDSIYPFSFIWSDVTFGTYKIYAKAVDIKGVEGFSYMDNRVVISEYQPPTLEIKQPISPDNIFLPGEDIDVYYSINDDDFRNEEVKKIEFYRDDSLIGTATYFTNKFTLTHLEMGSFKLTGKLYDQYNKISISNSIDITVKEGIWTDGIISKMISNKQNGYVYALNRDKKILHVIDSKQKKLVTNIILPYLNPISMAMSEDDKKIYIIYSNTGKITIVDINSYNTSHYTINAQSNSDIQIDSRNRRIFIIGSNSLSTYGQDNMNFIKEDRNIRGSGIALDNQAMLLYVAESYNSTIYTINDTVIQKSNIKLPGQFFKDFAFNYDMSKVALRCSTGNGVCCYKTSDLSNLIGQWSFGQGVNYIVFSKNSRFLFGSGNNYNDGSIYKMDANNYTEIEKYKTLNFSSSVLCTNNDDSILLAYIYQDGYSSEDKHIIIFYDI
ncbi:MAG: hypothetical protein EPN82_14435 [Bacteroidetes bacterium]|nr:MAG: hypothetical protein EPN82_14435 [Bacteroidota bacterium]